MATHQIPILGWATRPDNTGEAFFEPVDAILNASAIARGFVLALGASISAQPTVKHGVYGRFRVPQNYVSSPVLVIDWTASTTGLGNFVFDFDYQSVSGDNVAQLFNSSVSESVTVTDTAPTTTRRKMVATVNLTAGNFSPGAVIDYYFARDGTDAADTGLGRGYIVQLTFQYLDV